MTKSATVVRRNEQLAEAYDKVCELEQRAARDARCPTRGNWTNQNAVFTRALDDMFPLAKTILKGALLRDECRGAHYKPEFAMPSLTADGSRGAAKTGRGVVRPFRGKQSQVAQVDDRHATGRRPRLTYEEVDTSSDSATPAPLRPGRRQGHRGSVEGTAEARLRQDETQCRNRRSAAGHGDISMQPDRQDSITSQNMTEHAHANGQQRSGISRSGSCVRTGQDKPATGSGIA